MVDFLNVQSLSVLLSNSSLPDFLGISKILPIVLVENGSFFVKIYNGVCLKLH